MSGTRKGGIKAAATNKQRYGDDFYPIIGRAGGLAGAGQNKGFALNLDLAREAGRKGGQASRRKAKEID